MRARSPSGRKTKLVSLAVGLAVNVVFFGSLELALRLGGFEYSRFPQRLQQLGAELRCRE